MPKDREMLFIEFRRRQRAAQQPYAYHCGRMYIKRPKAYRNGKPIVDEFGVH